MTGLLILVLAQLLSDYVLHTSPMVLSTRSWRTTLLHGLVFSATAVLLNHLSQGQLSMGLILLATLAHLAVDLGRSHAGPVKMIHPAWVFVLTQVAHVFTNWVLVTVGYKQTAVAFKLMSALPLPIISLTEFWLAAASLFVLSVFGGSYWIPLLLDRTTGLPAGDPSPNDDDYVRSGFYIGILERISLFLIVVFRQPVALGVLVALKSLARHKTYSEDRHFAERFLVGTLISFLIAVVPAAILLLLDLRSVSG